MLSDVVLSMLGLDGRESLEEVENKLKETMQVLALLGLYRTDFFDKALFYGGSALRILHSLDRYSEDLDFSLLKSDLDFKISKYKKCLEDELTSHGFEVSFEEKIKSQKSVVSSAFMKANTLTHIIKVRSSYKTHRDAKLKIKLEVDTDPPSGFATEVKVLLRPIPFSVRTMSLPSLFAGKVSAMLCRDYTHNVKGRDWYDFVWYIGQGVPLNIHHLELRMVQTNHLQTLGLDASNVKDLIKRKAYEIDIDLARADVAKFIKDQSALALWSADFFAGLVDQMTFVDRE